MFVPANVRRRSAFASCSCSFGTVCGVRPCAVGKKKRRRDAADGVERCEVPDLGGAVQDEGSGGELDDAVDDVGHDHHPVPGEAVGDHAAEEEERDLRDEPRGEDDPEVARGAGDVQHGERERDGRDRAAREGRQPAGEEQPELAVPEGRERPAHAEACSARLRQ
jgi:hypothetical protein